jgi:hypothetical protein
MKPYTVVIIDYKRRQKHVVHVQVKGQEMIESAASYFAIKSLKHKCGEFETVVFPGKIERVE